MTDKQKGSYLTKLKAKWQDKLLMSHWNVELLVSDKPDQEDEHLQAQTHTGLMYYDVTVTFYPPYWELTESEKESVFVHELLHAILNQLKELAVKAKNGYAVFNDDIQKASEQTTSHLERIITRL